MTIKERIEEVKKAKEVLGGFVHEETYVAYLRGLVDAYEIEVANRFKESNND